MAELRDRPAQIAGEKTHEFLEQLGERVGIGQLREVATMGEISSAFAGILNMDESVLEQLGDQNMDSFFRRTEAGSTPISAAVSMALEGMVFGYLLRVEQEADRG